LPVYPLQRPNPASAVYAVAAVDCNGRVAERAVVQALGWSAGTVLNLRIRANLILVQADQRGAYVLAPPGYVRLPAAIRHRCGLVPGARLLLAADPVRQVLVMYPPAALDAMVSAFQAGVVGGGDA
jgi:hypothetical protein